MFSVLTLKIFLIFFPGILGVKIIELLVKGKKNFTNTQWIINSFLLGISSYLLMTLIPFVALDFEDIFSNIKDVNIPPENLLGATMIAFVLAGVITYIITQDLFHQLGKKLKLTNISSHPTVIKSIYNTSDEGLKKLQDSEIMIRRYNDGTGFKGKLKKYDLTNGNLEILLYNVNVYYDDKTDASYTLKSVYLNFIPSEMYIEYLND